ncbi:MULTISPECIES: hypothetical protein [Mesorhizobium]|uniref:OmpA-like domain-containing protein n=1 Tax=Mesorhizobium dulcispinae TaxID=3072316 RepID=A0ABU4XL21_9HYPH|nr:MULTISPECIES: hypothetical protein [unclassified Mesorhizobium]MDX8469022.1 hypothetical protein [Mesorhizobium sp. VK23B]MDX8475438.1 hypothetical protein [Mesorhizobium sp. VK23A]MDX8515514.1 hypothetical protein [Mesorhizobium sp. VK23E]
MVALNEPGGASVGYEKKGYARGLILGLTMAETMLLLVFCLLLVAGAIVAKKKAELETALEKVSRSEAEVRQLKQENKNLLAQVAELLERSTGHKVPDEEWRKLVRAKKAIEQIEQKGLTAEEAVSLAEATAAVRDNNLTADGVRKLVLADQRAADAERKLADAEKELAETTRQPKDLPPIINLSEAKGYSFEVSSAELKPAFKAKLEGAIAKQIAEIVAKYDVDVVEVIGHTDEQRLSRQSNMDFVLGRVLSGEENVSRMEPGDNAGLGLARAISVASVLKKKFVHLNILPMSGGQLILPDDRLTDGAQSGDAPERRRIEIRVRKSKQKLAAEGNHEGD